MTLEMYLKKHGIHYAEFAKTLDRAPTTINSIIVGHRMPSLRLAVEIEEVTNGEVRPRDFFTEEEL